MTLHRLRSVGERVLFPVVPYVRRAGITPALVSGVGLLTAAGAALAFAHRSYLLGVGLLAVSGWLDLLDGMLARQLGTASPAGFLLDQTLDRYADLLVLAGLTIGVGAYPRGIAAITGVLMTSFVGLGAKAVGVDRFLTGGFCRADRLALIAIAGTLTAVTSLTLIPPLLLVLGAGGHLTAVTRFYRIQRAVAAPTRDPQGK